MDVGELETLDGRRCMMVLSVEMRGGGNSRETRWWCYHGCGRGIS